MADGGSDILSQAVKFVLDNWTVLQLAVEQGFGGIDSFAKAKWLEDVIFQVLTDNERVEYEELEDYISEILYNEFHTIVEDGSLSKVSQKLCMFQKLWKEGNRESMEREITSTTSPLRTSGQAEGSSVEMEEGNKTVSEQLDGLHISLDSSCSNCQSNQQNNRSQNINSQQTSPSRMSMETDEQVEEGWQVVQRSKKRL